MMKVTIFLFENFEILDVFGPVEIMGRLPENFKVAYYSLYGGLIRSTQGVEIITRKIDDCLLSDILLVPGGIGTRKEVDRYKLIDSIKKLSNMSKYVLTVCTGSALLAKTGLLDGKRATSNKRAFDWAKSVRSEVEWVKKARWTVDGKFYTSSGVSAGMDMTLGFISDIISVEEANKIAREIEYEWNSDPGNDKFSQE